MAGMKNEMSGKLELTNNMPPTENDSQTTALYYSTVLDEATWPFGSYRTFFFCSKNGRFELRCHLGYPWWTSSNVNLNLGRFIFTMEIEVKAQPSLKYNDTERADNKHEMII